MLSVRCKCCQTELTSSTKTQCCGCPNMMTLLEDKVSASDLSKVILLKSETNHKKDSSLSKNDLEYQENRKKRKIRKLEFEIK